MNLERKLDPPLCGQRVTPRENTKANQGDLVEPWFCYSRGRFDAARTMTLWPSFNSESNRELRKHTALDERRLRACGRINEFHVAVFQEILAP
jgi:hypothetical protein